MAGALGDKMRKVNMRCKNLQYTIQELEGLGSLKGIKDPKKLIKSTIEAWFNRTWNWSEGGGEFWPSKPKFMHGSKIWRIFQRHLPQD